VYKRQGLDKLIRERFVSRLQPYILDFILKHRKRGLISVVKKEKKKRKTKQKKDRLLTEQILKDHITGG